MTVYVDNVGIKKGNRIYFHLMSDHFFNDEIHEFGQSIGLKRGWFHGDHYDIVKTKRATAVSLGAVEITQQQMVLIRQAKRVSRALSIKQPWLYCITDLTKRIENRTWKPPQFIIGKRIALHASKKTDRFEFDAADSFMFNSDFSLKHMRYEMPYGAIVATAKIAGWVHEDGSAHGSSPCIGHMVDDHWFTGPYGWILEEVYKLPKPIPCKGNLGLWHVPKTALPMLNKF